MYRFVFNVSDLSAEILIQITSQNKKVTTNLSAFASRIQISISKLKVIKSYHLFLCISAIMLGETKILEISVAVKRRRCQNDKVGYILLSQHMEKNSKIYTLDGDKLSNFQWLLLVIQRPLNRLFLRKALHFHFHHLIYLFIYFSKVCKGNL